MITICSSRNRNLENPFRILQIIFLGKLDIEEQYTAYTLLAFLAEVGGFVGLFLGLSILDLTNTMIDVFADITSMSQAL